MARKQQELDVEAVRRRSNFARRFNLRVALVHMPKPDQLGTYVELKPSIWRRLSVPGNVSLRDLHDRVLTPAFGFKRGHHAYYFSGPQDGSAFGPSQSDAIDMTHALYRIGCKGCMMDDEHVVLAQLVAEPGDRLSWVYDLGDNWEHKITVEAVTSEQSHEGAIVIDGSMACPPEDSVGFTGMGADTYEEKVLNHPNIKAGRPLPKEMQRALGAAINHRTKTFKPDAFSTTTAQARVDEAWWSKASYYGRDGTVGVSTGSYDVMEEMQKPRYPPVRDEL